VKILDIKRTKKQEVIKETIKTLKAGELIICPTETCYGAGVDTTNQKAVDKLLAYKRRREGKAISIAVADQRMAQKYVILNETAKNLYRNFFPGPLTVVSKSKSKVAKGLEAEDGTLGIRIPNYSLVLAIIKKFGKPITSTSANVAGKKTPYSLDDILQNITKKQQALIDLFLDAGNLPKNPPSTVVDTLLNEPRVLRQGEIKIAEKPGQVFISSSETETQQIASRILSSHISHITYHPLVFALQGELGAGKTQFAKGLGKVLGIKANISSPTFVLVREYPYSLDGLKTKDTSEVCACLRRQECTPARWRRKEKAMFYHLDTWRMQEGKELLEIGFEKMLKPGNIIAIEWLQKVKTILEDLEKDRIKLIWVTIEVLSETKRRIKFQL